MRTSLALILSCLLSPTVLAQQTADDIRRAAADYERQVYRENTDEGVAVSLRVGFETTVDAAKRSLTEVSELDATTSDRVEGLMTSDQGRLVAADRSAFWEVLSLETRPVVQGFEFAEHAAAINGMLAAIETQRERGTAATGLNPTVDALFKARGAQVWADAKLAELRRINRVLDSVFENRAEDTPVPEGLPALREAINQEIAARARRENRLIEAAEARAREDVRGTVEENAYNAALVAELQRAEQRAREMEAMLDRQRVEFDERLRALEIETKTQETMARVEHERQLAELHAEAEQMAAEIRLFKAQQAAATERVDQEAERTRLVAKAQRPETQTLLAPFLAEGFWQPGDRRQDIGLERQPMSYRKLVSFGALVPSSDGLAQLIAVINDRGFQAQGSGANTSRGGRHLDQDRPKLSLGPNWGHIDEDERARLAEMQSLLRELGPTLVELEMLAP